MKISAHNLLALAYLAMFMVLVHLAMVVAGTDTVSSSSSASKSVTTSASSKDKTKDTTKNTTTTSNQRKRGLCCNASCRECTRVPCNDHTECRIFGVSDIPPVWYPSQCTDTLHCAVWYLLPLAPCHPDRLLKECHVGIH
jgi:hypothetical protein